MVIIAAVWVEENKFKKNDFKKKTPETTSLLGQPPPQQADYFMENYTIISADAKGQPFRWLSGNRLTHYSNQYTALTQPKLQLSIDKQHWLLLAKSGHINKNQKIELDGNVNIQQLNGKEKSLVVKTEHLDVSLSDNTASTKHKVYVNNENGEVNAVGMSINFDQHQLRLLSNVKGHYVFD